MRDIALPEAEMDAPILNEQYAELEVAVATLLPANKTVSLMFERVTDVSPATK